MKIDSNLGLPAKMYSVSDVIRVDNSVDFLLSLDNMSDIDIRSARRMIFAGPRTGVLDFLPETGRFCAETGKGRNLVCADAGIIRMGQRTGRVDKNAPKAKPAKPGNRFSILILGVFYIGR